MIDFPERPPTESQHLEGQLRERMCTMLHGHCSFSCSVPCLCQVAISMGVLLCSRGKGARARKVPCRCGYVEECDTDPFDDNFDPSRLQRTPEYPTVASQATAPTDIARAHPHISQQRVRTMQLFVRLNDHEHVVNACPRSDSKEVISLLCATSNPGPSYEGLVSGVAVFWRRIRTDATPFHHNSTGICLIHHHRLSGTMAAAWRPAWRRQG